MKAVDPGSNPGGRIMKENKITIRLMKERDIPTLSEIYVRAYEIYNKWEHWNSETAYKLFSYWLDRQPDLAFVAQYDRKVVGAFVAGIKPWWDGNHLVDGELVVDPNYQNQRIGTRLLKTVLEKAVKKYDAVVWEAVTFKETEFPLSWYKKLGFDEINELTLIGGDVKKALKQLEK